MINSKKIRTARIDLNISVQAQLRFATIHKALGFKTKPETFEALVFSISAKDIIDPAVLDRIEDTLKHHTQLLESLS